MNPLRSGELERGELERREQGIEQRSRAVKKELGLTDLAWASRRPCG
ncbi:MAG: hypothetical protein JOZ15_22050 [Acidobacteria bacterium]|nr:hypothetical protein [Acidobacteriota bacterium]